MKPDVALLASADKCPAHDDGLHRMTDQGRDEAMFANRYECSCGRVDHAMTDENKVRLGIGGSTESAAGDDQ